MTCSKGSSGEDISRCYRRLQFKSSKGDKKGIKVKFEATQGHADSAVLVQLLVPKRELSAMYDTVPVITRSVVSPSIAP